MLPSPSATPSPARLRRHAATLVLVVACLGTVATSQPRSPPATTEHIGTTVRLTQDMPTSTRRFVMRVSARDSSETAEGYVEGLLTARWTSADATASPGPTLRSRLARVGDTNEPSRTITLSTPGTSLEEYAGAAYFDGCDLDEGCELEVELSFEVQGELGAGFVDVDWKLYAEAITRTGEAPKGFTVELEER